MMPDYESENQDGVDQSEITNPAVDVEALAGELSPENTAEFSEEKVQELLKTFQEDFEDAASDVDGFINVTTEQARVLQSIATTELPRLKEMVLGTSLETSINGLIALISSVVAEIGTADGEQPSKDTRLGNLELNKQSFTRETLGSESVDTLLRTADEDAYKNNEQRLNGAMDSIKYAVSSSAASLERDIDAIVKKMAEVEQYSFEITDADTRGNFNTIANDLSDTILAGVRRQMRQVSDDTRTHLVTLQDRVGNRASSISQEKFPARTS